MKKYQVIYRTRSSNDSRVFKVMADSKQMACDTFRNVVSRTHVILDIIEVKPKKKSWFDSIPNLVVALIVTFIFIGISTACYISWGRPSPTNYETYTVEKGDTLWELARLSDGWNHMDGWYIVDDMKTASETGSVIYPGQIIYIPMYDK